MDFDSKKKTGFSLLTEGRSSDNYLHNLQLYSIPPAEYISLQEFEELAIDRLKGRKLE